MSTLTNRFNQEREVPYSPETLPASLELDQLALYDCQSIGCEFAPVKLSRANMAPINEARRSELFMNSWKETSSLKDTQPLPKAEQFMTTRRWQTRRAVAQPVISFLLFAGCTVLLGALVGVILNRFRLPGL